MQARVDWVLIIFGTQVIKKKRPVRPVFPDYLSVSSDYDLLQSAGIGTNLSISNLSTSVFKLDKFLFDAKFEVST